MAWHTNGGAGCHRSWLKRGDKRNHATRPYRWHHNFAPESLNWCNRTTADIIIDSHFIDTRLRYAANSASFSGAASSTTANLSAELHCSGFCPSPGTARPCSRACLRHRYSVASGTPVSCATAATGLLCGALIWLSACSFFSLVYFVIVKSIAPGQIRTPIAGGDNYFDRGGRLPRWPIA